MSVEPVLRSVSQVQICNNQLPYSWNGHTYLLAGTYTDTLKAAAGCDSIATLELTINQVLTSSATITRCSNELPYSWNGKQYTEAGTYTDTLKSAAGCDSVATLVLQVNPVAVSTTAVTICSSQLPYSWNGQVYTASGTYTDTLQSVAGCDSVTLLILQVTQAVTSTTNATICTNRLPYSWHGKLFTAAGVYRDTLTSQAGCDSIAVLDLRVNPVAISNASISICSGQLPYRWNGRPLTTSGVYTDTLIGAAGCDSLAVLELTVKPAVFTTITINISVNKVPYNQNGRVFLQAGTYRDTLLSATGCDSIVTTILSVISPSVSTTNIVVCPNQLPYTWNGKPYSAPGTYTDSLRTVSGYDSIATLILSVNPVATSSTLVAVCSNALPYQWNGRSYPAAGIYNDTLRSATGCDSIATLVLQLQPAATSTSRVTICASQLPYSWNGKRIAKAGVYSDTLRTAAGCDSIATLNLDITAVQTSTVRLAICSKELPYKWRNKSYNREGTYSDTLTSAGGCDSIVTLELTIKPVVTSTVNRTVCTSQLPFSWNSRRITAAGTYKDTLTSTEGCDSIVTLTLGVSPVVYSSTTAIICQNQQPYKWNRGIYNTAGTYIDTLKTTGGCDSVVTLILKMDTSGTVTENITICAASYTLPNGTTVTASGVYTSTLSSTTGCDKTIITRLTLQGWPKLVVSNPSVVCAPAVVDLTLPAITVGSDSGLVYKYWTNAAGNAPLVNPDKLAASGTYYISATGPGGCTTIKPVTVTVNPAPKLVITAPAPVCAPTTVDLTAAAVTTGSSGTWTYTYWKDAAATTAVANPKAVAASGTYFIRATAQTQCSITQTIPVKVSITSPMQGLRRPTVTAVADIPVQLQARYFSSNTSYTWEPAAGLNTTTESSPQFKYNKDMEYTVKATYGAGCITVDTIPVKVQTTSSNDIRSDIFVPKAWTPNNDGHNDRLFPLTVHIRKLNYFRIFNRWGQLVFETSEIGKGWDGIFNGKPQVADVYTWMLDAIGEDDRHFNMTGNSILVR
ncbi:MAG: gliding motility-associated C-terminal domain-containing protein [Williamsia sp.]|nr:gliding motility-associated C-terminal domain-containing protein [Williamsia sp.]